MINVEYNIYSHISFVKSIVKEGIIVLMTQAH